MAKGKRSGDAKGVLHGTKRQKKALKDNIRGITKPAIRRLARRGGGQTHQWYYVRRRARDFEIFRRRCGTR